MIIGHATVELAVSGTSAIQLSLKLHRYEVHWYKSNPSNSRSEPELRIVEIRGPQFVTTS